jgi:hypothetical protein
MKDNTLLYVGLGLAAVYLFMQKKAVLPTGTVTIGPLQAAPLSQQTGILLPLFNKIVAAVTPSNNGLVSTEGLNFTPIPAQTATDASNLTVTDATGTTYYGQGVTYNPNAALDNGPSTLPVPVINAAQTNDPSATFDLTGD